MSIYTPHTDKDLAEMLAAVGVKKLDDLYADAPKGLKVDKYADVQESAQVLQKESGHPGIHLHEEHAHQAEEFYRFE